MKRFMTMVSVLAICVFATNSFASDPDPIPGHFGWTISTSSVDPNVCYSAVPLGGPGTVYLWLECDSGQTGAAASEWQMVPTGLFWGGIAGVAPYLFTGPPTDLLGAFGNVSSQTLVGIITVFDFGGGSLCFAPSVANNRNITVGVDGKGYPNKWRGLHTAGFGPVCCETKADDLCAWTAVETETWGSIKSLYR
jgi:hypothetical protein